MDNEDIKELRAAIKAIVSNTDNSDHSAITGVNRLIALYYRATNLMRKYRVEVSRSHMRNV